MDIAKFNNVAKFKPLLSLNIFLTHICVTGLFSSLLIRTSTLNFLLSLWTCLPWKSRLWSHHELGQGVLVFPLDEWLWVAGEYKFPQWWFDHMCKTKSNFSTIKLLLHWKSLCHWFYFWIYCRTTWKNSLY